MWKPTGTNVIPLGTKRRHDFQSETSTEENGLSLSITPPPVTTTNDDNKIETTATNATDSIKIDSATATSTPESIGNNNSEANSPAERKRKRKSRWGTEDKVASGIPILLPKEVDEKEKDNYILKIRLEEINRKLRTNDVVPPERERSPSPEPVYNADGKRVNTREFRYRKKLEDERHKLVEQAIKAIPNFVPPSDYKKPTKLQEKVYIPAKEFPEINFIGLLIGPRGKTLKSMEQESGAKISIRGRGSVKEGKSRTDAAANSAQEEDLHCLVMADSEDKIRKAVKQIEKIIETSASTPEGQNELKRTQLRELAALNGTLRDDENQTCLNCGSSGHRRYECPERQNFTANLTCRICGGHGHIAKDCNQRDNPELLEAARVRDQQLDTEYLNLMAELGEKPDNKPTDSSNYGYGSNTPTSSAPTTPAPWLHNSNNSSNNNNNNNQNTNQQNFYPPTTNSNNVAPPWQRDRQQPQPQSQSQNPFADAPWHNPAYANAYDPSAYYNAGGSYGHYEGYSNYDNTASHHHHHQHHHHQPQHHQQPQQPWDQVQYPPPPPPTNEESWDGNLPPPPPPSANAPPPPPPSNLDPPPPPPPQ
ncbi:unnamed protein product [Cunninghamella blakesleeana]